jgi:hypothetical protein
MGREKTIHILLFLIILSPLFGGFSFSSMTYGTVFVVVVETIVSYFSN